MAHPFQSLRQDRVEKSRVSKLTHGYADGGEVDADAMQKMASVAGNQKASLAGTKSAMESLGRKRGGKVKGAKSHARLDRYARGGKVKNKGTNVTVVVAPQGGGDKPPMPIPAMPPQGAMPPPRPPMAPPMAGPPMMPPPGMPPRRSGGRAYAKGGAVKDGPAWKEGLRNGTQVSHTDGKSDTKDIVRPRQVTYKRGGKVEASSKVVHNIDDGAGGGLGRLEKIKLQKRK